jgi:hypothetical protein
VGLAVTRAPLAPLAALIDALAVYRLTRLIIEDEVTEPVRDAVQQRFGAPHESRLSYLLTCPYCVSVYAAAAVSVADMIAPRFWRPVSRALALSAAVCLVYDRD